MVLAFCQPMTNPQKITRSFLGAFALSSLVLMLIYTRNIMVLGDTLVERYYFPSYEVVRLARVGMFLQGLQIIGALVIMVGYYVKITIFLYAATLGISKLIKMSTKMLAAPVGMLFMVFSLFVVKDMPDLLRWVKEAFTLYSLPTGLLLPLVLLVVGMWKDKRRRNKQRNENEAPQEERQQSKLPEETPTESGA